jgi:alpha-galactosidase/6-phospho-beta-glucosidase family protein
VRRLRKRHRNKLEILLSIFDQSNASKESKHFLDLLESSFPDEFKAIIRRLHKASASKELCEDMEIEDEILEELATQERLIAYERAEREKAEAEKRKAEEGKEKAEAEKARLEKLLKQAGIKF